MVAGFDAPTRGAVRFDGEPVRTPSPRRAVVFQEPALFPWYTVLDNITFGLRTRGIAPSAYRDRVQTIIEQVGLQGFESHYPAELSGGLKQRVGIARVLVMEPDVLLMDEPFGSLDAQTRSVMQELLLSVWERHQQTVLFVTHDIEEALLLADSVSVMTARPGRIKKRLAIELPRPRALEVTTSPFFNELKREVLALIREEKREGGGRARASRLGPARGRAAPRAFALAASTSRSRAGAVVTSESMSCARRASPGPPPGRRPPRWRAKGG
jgi:ABC-type nitrate/sulfonate/bicarbonate transport system ATPase subunit